MSALMLTTVGCSLGDFDSLGAGPDQNIGGSGGSAGRAGSAGDGGTAGTSGSGGTGDAGSGGSGGSAGSSSGGNLIPSGDFDNGISNWTCVGNCTTMVVDREPRSGTRCLLTTDRTQVWEGPSLNLLDKTTPGLTYEIRVWVRAEPSDDPDAGPPEPFSIGITQKRACVSTDPPDGAFTQLSSGTASSEWSELSGIFPAPDCEDLAASTVYVERAPVGMSFCIDDTSLTLVE